MIVRQKDGHWSEIQERSDEHVPQQLFPPTEGEHEQPGESTIPPEGAQSTCQMRELNDALYAIQQQLLTTPRKKRSKLLAEVRTAKG